MNLSSIIGLINNAALLLALSLLYDILITPRIISMREKGESEMSEMQTMPALIEEKMDKRQITRVIRPMLHRLTSELLETYAIQLLLEPDDYIVPAIWGTKMKGELDDVQRQIHDRINLSVMLIRDMVRSGETTLSQDFAIEFLVRESILFNIAYSLERSRYLFMTKEDPVKRNIPFNEIILNEFFQTLGTA